MYTYSYLDPAWWSRHPATLNLIGSPLLDETRESYVIRTGSIVSHRKTLGLGSLVMST
jgi:hypothetical protein